MKLRPLALILTAAVGLAAIVAAAYGWRNDSEAAVLSAVGLVVLDGALLWLTIGNCEIAGRVRMHICFSIMLIPIAVFGLLFTCFGCPLSMLLQNSDCKVEAFRNNSAIGKALLIYHDDRRRLPPATIRDAKGRPLLSWRVAILPHLGIEALHSEFKLNEPWDSPHNKKLLKRMPAVYAPPARLAVDAFEGETFIQVFVGPGTAFEETERGLTLSKDFPDGAGGTILCIEGGKAVPWTKPEDLPYHRDRPIPALGGVFTRKKRYSLLPAPGPGEGGITMIHIITADGSVHTLSQPLDETKLRRAIVRNDGKGWELD